LLNVKLCSMTKVGSSSAIPGKVSFLTVNFFQPEVTLSLLASLQNLSYSNWECIVVNNGGVDTTLRSECENIDRVTYLESEKNLGFAGGNNMGLPYCTGEYIFFINNDTEVEPGLMEPILQVFRQEDKVGMLSPKIVFDFDRKTIQHAGATDLSRYTLRNSAVGFGEKDNGQYDRVYTTNFVHGAAMVVPAEVIKEVGPMREDYFLYYEEYDWCMRIRKAGYKIMYCGLSTVYHKESVSTGADSPFKIFYLNRNRLLFARRNLSSARAAFFTFYFTVVVLPFHAVRYIVKGEIKKAFAFFKALSWNLSKRKV